MSDVNTLALLAVIRGLHGTGAIDSSSIQAIVHELLAAGNLEHGRCHAENGKALINLG